MFTSSLFRKFGSLLLFSMAMGFLEAIVVIYLRVLYYPEGFSFPMQLLPQDILAIEWIRETATLIMLASIGFLAGKNNLQRLFYALYAFGVWDIVYYVALKMLIGWPESLLTWDLLFLIPIPWLGPVLAPVICSVVMIIMALIIIKTDSQTGIRIRTEDWLLILSGAMMILFTFLADYIKIISDSGVSLSGNTPQEIEALLQNITSFIPGKYYWAIFISGIILIIIPLVKILKTKIKHI